MREFKTAPLDANTEELSLDADAYRSRVDEFFKAELREEHEKKAASTAKDKWSRIATSDVAYAADRMCRIVGAHGWGRLQKEKIGAGIAVNLRPRCSLTWDMGPDMLCLTNYFLYQRQLNIAVFFSPCHKAQRCMFGGTQRSGKHAVVLISTIMANLPRGHFDSESVFNMLKDSARDWQAKTTKDDKFLEMLAPKILRDRGEEFHNLDDDCLQSIHDNICSTQYLQRKPVKVALSHWHSWNDALEQILSEWHECLIPKLNIGISQGWCKPDAVHKFLQELNKLDLAKVNSTVGSVKESSQATASLRDKCKSALKITTFAQLDPQFHEDLFFIVSATRCWRNFNGKLQKCFGTLADVKKFHLDMLGRRGMFWDALKISLSPFSNDLAHLAKVGFIIAFDFGPNVSTVWDHDDVIRLEQRRLARNMWHQILCQSWSYLIGFNHFYDGYPCRFFALLDDELKSKDKDAVWRDFIADYNAYKHARTLDDPIFKKLGKRSMIGWTENAAMLEAAIAGDSDAVISNARRIIHYPGDSLVLEKTFQESADQERDSSNKRMAAAAMYKRLVNSTLLTTQFQLGRPAHVDDVQDAQHAKSELPSSVFELKAKDASMCMRDLASKKASPEWATFKSDGWHSLVSEMKFERHCFDTNEFNRAGMLWKTELVFDQLVLYSRRDPGEVLFSMRIVGPVMLMWKLHRVPIGPDMHFEFAPPDSTLPYYRVVHELSDWEVEPFEWVSPLDLLVGNKGRSFDKWPNVFARACGKPMPLLVFAAEKGFGTKTNPFMKRLMTRELGISPEDDFMTNLIKSIMHLHPILTGYVYRSLLDIQIKHRV